MANTPRATRRPPAARAAPQPASPPSPPASGSRRKKAPAQVRAKLLQAASDLAREHGAQAVTLDAVAERAAVSKGGLQYHFRSKQALLDALFEQTIIGFQRRVAERAAADPMPSGAQARAYLHVSVDEEDPIADGDVLRVLVASMMSDPDVRARWSAPLRDGLQPDQLPLAQAAIAMICRLAADGLWFADVLGYQSMSRALRDEVVRQLDQMTRMPPPAAPDPG
ncbi:TetR/AcrR family transcriptional regulator [Burkholderia sp. FERM BP-3421]|uniref:TetR/AcrR family transcriptional regulator n=1 Tax=Burkholderia sp. FERM BP-3421 TaxID=1494466 RepID=UPI00235ED6A2|nr:TetR/AcrR family transcriptional regulator [Burkholderia sp. FERM BP-3421]WDD92225.1 TetR/AcrR family transcriptional regulator [Burkholderia sp. FERM BP-3421]